MKKIIYSGLIVFAFASCQKEVIRPNLRHNDSACTIGNTQEGQRIANPDANVAIEEVITDKIFTGAATTSGSGTGTTGSATANGNSTGGSDGDITDPNNDPDSRKKGKK